MTTSIITVTPASLGALAEQASTFLVESVASNTRKAYEGDHRRFHAWCKTHALESLPASPTTVGLYLTDLAGQGKQVSTIERTLSAISAEQRAHGYAWPKGHPAITGVMQGIRRKLGVAPKQKAPVMDADLVRMVGTLGVDLVGMRDRAILTVGWFGAFRRSEVAGIDVEHIRFTNDGVIVHMPFSKTDQEGQGYDKGLPYAGTAAACPVRSLKGWLDASGITKGPVFRAIDTKDNLSPERMNDRTVARIIQRAADAAGIAGDIGGHSLRAGFMTSAAAKGKSLDAMMRQSGHRSERQARGYIRHANLFTANAAAGLL